MSYAHSKSLSMSTQGTAVNDDEPVLSSYPEPEPKPEPEVDSSERCTSPYCTSNSGSGTTSSSTGSLEIDTYRRLLAGMAETCRTLQARIKILESDLALRSEHNRRLLCGSSSSPVSSPSPLSPSSFQLQLPPRSSVRQNSKWDNRRHSAPPQLVLGTVLEVSEDFSDDHDVDEDDGGSEGSRRDLGSVNARSEVWMFHDDRARSEEHTSEPSHSGESRMPSSA